MTRTTYLGIRGLLRGYEAVQLDVNDPQQVTLYYLPHGWSHFSRKTADLRHEPGFGWCLEHRNDGGEILDGIDADVIDPRDWSQVTRQSVRMAAIGLLALVRKNLARGQDYVANVLRRDALEILSRNP